MDLYVHPLRSNTLEQGDLLGRTDALLALLEKYHPYYKSRDENKYFAVLTQSCDLVRRPSGIGARYVALAPVRPLRTVLRREFEGKLDNVGVGAQPFGPQRTRTSMEQLLSRLFNNNEPQFFYYPGESSIGVAEDSCAILALSISLKPEHYDSLLAAKIAGISDVFQAKLGWLVGQMYSRVGTPDAEPAELTKKVSEYLKGVALWLDESQLAALRPAVAQYLASNPGSTVNAQVLQRLLATIPKRKSLVIDAVLDVLATKGIARNPSPERRMIRLALEADPSFAAALK